MPGSATTLTGAEWAASSASSISNHPGERRHACPCGTGDLGAHPRRERHAGGGGANAPRGRTNGTERRGARRTDRHHAGRFRPQLAGRGRERGRRKQPPVRDPAGRHRAGCSEQPAPRRQLPRCAKCRGICERGRARVARPRLPSRLRVEPQALRVFHKQRRNPDHRRVHGERREDERAGVELRPDPDDRAPALEPQWRPAPLRA